MSVRLKLKISVTAEPIGLYSTGNISTGPVMVLSIFLEGESPPPQIKIKIYLHFLLL